jgi:hypothetical protein
LHRVVQIPWQDWDAGNPEPASYPAGGEPENYLLRRKHSESAASTIPPLFERYVQDTPGLQSEGMRFNAKRWNGNDIARASNWGHIFVTERLARWLVNEVPMWVSLAPAASDA